MSGQESWRSPSQQTASPGVRSSPFRRMAAYQDAAAEASTLVALATKRRSFLIAAGSAVVVMIIVMLRSSGTPSSAPTAAIPTPGPVITPTVTASAPSEQGTVTQGTDEGGSTGPGIASPGRASYYQSAASLAGLPPDIVPGTRIELWVAWEPPVVDAPRVQRLLTDVYVEAIVAPLTPDGPVTAKLSLRRKDIPDMIYADRYGRLNVIMPPPG